MANWKSRRAVRRRRARDGGRHAARGLEGAREGGAAGAGAAGARPAGAAGTTPGSPRAAGGVGGAAAGRSRLWAALGTGRPPGAAPARARRVAGAGRAPGRSSPGGRGREPRAARQVRPRRRGCPDRCRRRPLSLRETPNAPKPHGCPANLKRPLWLSLRLPSLQMGCLARDLAALARQHEEAQCRAWSFSREAEELRRELEQARGLLQEAQAGRLALEARWVREKALEARRVNRANEQQQKYRKKVMRLQEELAQAREKAVLPGLDLDQRGGSFGTSSEEAESG